jgi:hypothetical protein
MFRREAVVELEDVVVVAEMIGMNTLVTALKRWATCFPEALCPLINSTCNHRFIHLLLNPLAHGYSSKHPQTLQQPKYRS